MAAITLAEGNCEQSRDYLARVIALLDREPGKRGVVAAQRARLEALMNA
jgi:hypothetical protein